MTVERFLAKLSAAERAFLLSWDIERHITPAGLAQAAVWFCQNTCSAEMLRFLFPGMPVLRPRPGMLGAAMVDDLAHLVRGSEQRRCCGRGWLSGQGFVGFSFEFSPPVDASGAVFLAQPTP